MEQPTTVRALRAAELRARVLRGHVHERLSLRTVAREYGISVKKAKLIVAEAMQQAAAEESEWGRIALERELQRIGLLRADAWAIAHTRCPVCSGAQGGCAVCQYTGRLYPPEARLEAMGRLADLWEAEAALAGPIRHARLEYRRRLQDINRRFWPALGHVTREDFHELIDSYLSAEYEHLGRRALAGATTRFPMLAAKLREDLGSYCGHDCGHGVASGARSCASGVGHDHGHHVDGGDTELADNGAGPDVASPAARGSLVGNDGFDADTAPAGSTQPTGEREPYHGYPTGRMSPGSDFVPPDADH